MKFPNNFLWGGATSAAQYEGDYDTNNKGLSVIDVMTHGSHIKPREIHEEILEGYRYPSHLGVKGIENLETDVKLMADAGFKSYRFSIAWTRIFPTGMEENPNLKGFEYYDRLIDLLIKNNIEPVVTICHFDMPLALAKNGGWQERSMIKYFENYCVQVLKRYSTKVKYWMVFNEINNNSTMPWMASGIKESTEENKMFAAFHQLLANARIINIGKKINPDFMFGLMYNSHFPYAASTDPKDVQGTIDFMHQMLFYADVMCRGKYPNYKLKELERLNIGLPVMDDDLEQLKTGTVDYVSFSYYLTHVTGQKTKGILKGLNGLVTGYKNEHLDETDWGFSINPQGLRHTCNFLYYRYNLPLMISENGLGTKDEVIVGNINDDYRIDYLKSHIIELEKAINIDGIPVIGYMMWSPFDIVSASTGEMAKRYGLIYIDYNDEGKGTFKRIPKKSYYWYKELISKNGEAV